MRVSFDLVLRDRKSSGSVSGESDIQPLGRSLAILGLRSADDEVINLDDEERARLDERLPIHEPALERQPGPPQNLQVGFLREHHGVGAAHR